MTANTLHLCNLSVVENTEMYFEMIQGNDAIIFYTNMMSTQQYNDLKHHPMLKSVRVYFIVDEKSNNIPTINDQQWVVLVNQYSRTFTWK